MRHKNWHYGDLDGLCGCEHRLIHDAAESRKLALTEAESTEGVLQKHKQDPANELVSHTEKLAAELKRINQSWFNVLTFRRTRLAKKAIRGMAEQKLTAEYGKFNGWLYRIMHWGERRIALARGREQVTKDLLGYLQREKNDVLTFKSRFARAAEFIGKHKIPVSAKELKRTQNLEKLLGPIERQFSAASARHTGKLSWMEGARETEELIRTELLNMGVKEEAVEALIEDNVAGGASLVREIKGKFSSDQRRKMLRAARRLRRYPRFRMLNAATEDLNALPAKERLERINSDEIRSRTVELDLRGKKFRTCVLSRKAPYLTLLDLGKGRKKKDAYMVLDTRDGVLLRKEEGREREHDMIGNRDNIFRVPSGLRLAA